MNIISIDLPWETDKKGRRVLAIADLDGKGRIAQASDDNQMLELVRECAEPASVVLLDIPVDGCENQDGRHFRPIDRAIARQTLPALPASRAGDRGKRLKQHLENDEKRLTVYEIYPYALYKFLAYLKKRNLLQHLNSDRFNTLLDDGFRTYWPPKYKREKTRAKRRENMEYLYSLLTDIGLNLDIPLRYPDTSSNLGQLSDEYDACLGLIVGLHLANDSPYACIAGDSSSGNILLLADRWLSQQLGKEVRILQPEKRSQEYAISYQRTGKQG